MNRVFRPAALLLALALLLPAPASAANDHQASAWARQEVSDAVMGGLSPFPPYPEPLDYQGDVTRREFAGVAVHLYAALTLQFAPNLQAGAAASPFADAAGDRYVDAACALGLMNGTGVGFEPERSITRQEICVLLDRVVDKAGAALPQAESAAADALAAGSEGPVPDWAVDGVRKLVASGLMKGTGGGYDLLGHTSREMALVLSLRTLRAVQAQPPLLGRRSANGWAFAVEDAAELMKVLKETMPKAPDCLTFYTRQPVTQAQLSALGLPVDGNYTQYPELALDYGLFAGGWFMACEISDGPEGYASACTLKPAYDSWAYLDQYRRGLRDFLPAGIYAWSDPESVERTPADYGPLTAAVAALDGTVVTPGMSDYEKAKALHDYAAELIEYDYAQLRADSVVDYLSGYGYPANLNRALLDGKGVCAAYAGTYTALCNLFGLRCVDTVGTAGGDSHAWNVVEVDGQWYQVDVTWDDKGSSVSYKYFLVSDASLAKDHHWTLPYPVCPEDYSANHTVSSGQPSQGNGSQSQPTGGGETPQEPSGPQDPRSACTVNPDFPGTYLGETADGLWEFEITVPADRKNLPYPFDGGRYTQMEISDTGVVGQRAQYFYGRAPGKADVTYSVCETHGGDYLPLCVVHVTVVEAE